MKKIFILMLAIIFVTGFVSTDAFAVSAPSVKKRQEAERGHKKEQKEKARDQRESGCDYGKDKITGKCYEPKEGQFYRDPTTGEMKVKKIKKINTPW